MWQILKSEIEYNRWILICSYFAALFFFVIGILEDDIYTIVPNTIVPFFIGYGFLCHRYCKESRERQHCMLPQSRTHYGVTRMAFFALFQSGILLMWLVAYLIGIAQTPEAIWMILTANALMLTFRAVGFIFEDTRSEVGCITSAAGWTPSSIAQRVMRFLTYVVLTTLLLIVAAGTEGDGFTLLEMDVDWQPVIDLREFLRAPSGAFLASTMFMITFYLSAVFSLPRRSIVSTR